MKVYLKILSLVLVSALLFSMVACSASNATADQTKNDSDSLINTENTESNTENTNTGTEESKENENNEKANVFKICQEPYLLFKYSNNLYSCDEIIIACDFNISNCS